MVVFGLVVVIIVSMEVILIEVMMVVMGVVVDIFLSKDLVLGRVSLNRHQGLGRSHISSLALSQITSHGNLRGAS